MAWGRPWTDRDGVVLPLGSIRVRSGEQINTVVNNIDTSGSDVDSFDVDCFEAILDLDTDDSSKAVSGALTIVVYREVGGKENSQQAIVVVILTAAAPSVLLPRGRYRLEIGVAPGAENGLIRVTGR